MASGVHGVCTPHVQPVVVSVRRSVTGPVTVLPPQFGGLSCVGLSNETLQCANQLCPFGKYTEKQKDRKTERQKDRKTERQKDRKTESLIFFGVPYLATFISVLVYNVIASSTYIHLVHGVRVRTHDLLVMNCSP